MQEAVVGSVIADRLVLRREIARGGMGVVFEAEHRRLRTPVAVKLLNNETLGNVMIRERLFREAEVLARVRDRGIVRVLDCAEDEHHGPYFVMEMLRGRALDGLLASRHQLPLSDVVKLVNLAAQALAEVHSLGVVHRDVKPANLFIVREGREDIVKLLDFGIALLPDGDAARHRLTRPGSICGTPEYMAPEQLFAQDAIDARADVFALAATAYECLTGRVPFGSDLQARTHLHARGVGASMLNVLNPAISLAVARVIDKALSVDPAQRFDTAEHFAAALAGVANVGAGPLQLLSPTVGSPASVAAAAVAVPAPTSLSRTTVGVTDPTELVIDLVQRRRSPRAPYLTPVRVLAGPDNEIHDGRAQDISESGMQIVLNRELSVGTKVTLRFALPMSGTLAVVRAVVRWARSNRGQTHAIGFEFEHPLEHGADFVRRYVAWFSESESR